MGEQVKQNVNQNKIQEFMNKAIGDTTRRDQRIKQLTYSTLPIFLFVIVTFFLVIGSVQKSNAMPEPQYFNALDDSDNDNNNIKHVSTQHQISSNVKKVYHRSNCK